VSGFYKLLTVAMGLSKKGAFFAGMQPQLLISSASSSSAAAALAKKKGNKKAGDLESEAMDVDAGGGGGGGDGDLVVPCFILMVSLGGRDLEEMFIIVFEVEKSWN
jgi:NAD(P)H-hydrate repair Nnr-like enzyme with NAD(P)H-hydrate epimerase domain